MPATLETEQLLPGQTSCKSKNRTREFFSITSNLYIWDTSVSPGIAIGNAPSEVRFCSRPVVMWISPDPASQFFNPYAFGGDGVNFEDPDGLWKIGIGISLGWTKKGGFSLGFGVGIEDVDLGVVNLNTYGGADYNFSSGSTTYSANAGVGGTQYWSGFYGDYQGSTFYAQTFTGAFGARAYAGHEWGFGGMEGRGFYAGVSAFGFSTDISQNGGWNYGGKEDLLKVSYVGEGKNVRSIEAKVMWKEYTYDHINRNQYQPDFKNYDQFAEYGLEKQMSFDPYNETQSMEHNRGGESGNIKVWMGNEPKKWWSIPAIEGVFKSDGSAVRNFNGPSYNYGNNLASHFVLDMMPYYIDKALQY